MNYASRNVKNCEVGKKYFEQTINIVKRKNL